MLRRGTSQAHQSGAYERRSLMRRAEDMGPLAAGRFMVGLNVEFKVEEDVSRRA